MASKGISFMNLFLLLLALSLSWIEFSDAQTPTNQNISIFSRKSFPKDFTFGAASAAYQYEGASTEDERGPSIWDTFSQNYPNKIADHTTGNVTNDFYHRYKEDIQLMKSLGLDSFRLSISWSRVIPSGKLSKGVNKAGIAFYNNVINELLANGITPFVTIFHWDLPQPLEDEYGGFLSSRIVDDYVDFSELCFKEFGDRVKHWTTFNEPLTFTAAGYDSGILAPGRCSSWRNNDCPAGNSATEPYLVAHNILLSHGAIVDLYRKKYKPSQNGEIGIVLNPTWYVPYTSNKADKQAARRALEFAYGWFLDPLVHGDYPPTMRRLVGRRLPKFTAEQSKLVKGSLDYLGVNYYSASFAAHLPSRNRLGANISYTTDSQTNLTTIRKGLTIGEAEGVSGLFVYPQGLREILVYTKNKYNNPKLYVTENGYGDRNVSNVEEAIKDLGRARFYEGHLKAIKQAIDEGVKVKGFFPWSFMDMWEWNSGFAQNYGLIFVDRKNGLKRHLKTSALWYKKFLNA
ncbi:OLC1v1001645C1 [Oldenlandia corymbosa var. corymbosa]|uniref:OLC1v1001645C1 n=1 Tax=Oldenlandia corymbosa var. corymbosa TaxID=529605 RepID=A0AAV1D5R0_OLDCO|nr:OLC1v1001645C1 [Oldenlandia corymbosa var. corymbosa]